MKPFKNLLFVAERDQDNAAPLRQALTLCANNQARLTVVSVVPEVAFSGKAPLRESLIEQRAEWLSSLLAATDTGDVSVDSRVLCGRAFVAIISEVLSRGSDLVIKPAQSETGRKELRRGATDKKLLRKCPCPVWLIKSTERQGDLEFVVALDYEPDNPENEPLNRQLLEVATSLALSEFAELHVVHAWRLEHEDILRSAHLGLTPAEVDSLVSEEQLRRRSGLKELIERYCTHRDETTQRFLQPQLHLVNGSAVEAVPALADKLGAELVIMGTVGRTGIPGLLIGNTAESIVSQLDKSILTVKPAGFVSPVAANTD